jgi:hypothetical protein
VAILGVPSTAKWGGLQQMFYGIVYNQGSVRKPEQFAAYRERRPERPPAGKIACHTKRAN